MYIYHISKNRSLCCTFYFFYLHYMTTNECPQTNFSLETIASSFPFIQALWFLQDTIGTSLHLSHIVATRIKKTSLQNKEELENKLNKLQPIHVFKQTGDIHQIHSILYMFYSLSGKLFICTWHNFFSLVHSSLSLSQSLSLSLSFYLELSLNPFM